MSLHHDLIDANVHTPYRKVFANQAARLADAGPYTTNDLNKKALQVDDNTEYRLTAITPVWTAVGSVSGYTATVILTEAADGTSMSAGTEYVLGQTADFGVKLPSTTGLAIGSRVLFLSAGGDYRCVVSCDDRAGAATEAIIGEGCNASTYISIAGLEAEYIFEYLGTGLGAPYWKVSSSIPLAAAGKSPVQYATSEALAAHTQSGVDENVILTADANVQLVVDGQIVADTSGPVTGGVFVKNDNTKNGLYQILDQGSDGVRPWILRKRIDWHFDGHTDAGATIEVAAGPGGGWFGSNQGRQFVTPVGLAASNLSTDDIRERNRPEDRSGGGWGFTSGVANDVLSSIPTIANDTTLSVRVRTVGQDDTSNEMLVYVDEVMIKRNSAGTVTVEQTDGISVFEDFTPPSRGVKFNVNGSLVDIEAQGTAAHDVQWRTEWAAMYLPLGGG